MAPPRSTSLSITARYWLAIATLIVVWMAVAGFGVPWAIHQLYAGRGPGFLVAVLGGRGDVPVERYLGAWEQLTRSISILFILSALLGYVFMRLVVATRHPVTADGAGPGLPAEREWSGAEDGAGAAA